MPSPVAKIHPVVQSESEDSAEAQDGTVPRPVLLGNAGQAEMKPEKIPSNGRNECSLLTSSLKSEECEDLGYFPSPAKSDGLPQEDGRKSRAYYNSKNFVLEAIRKSKSDIGSVSIASQSASLLVENPLFSADDAWLVGSNIVKLRNPYCVGNAPVPLQLAFWLRVSAWTALYAFVVGMASFGWVNFWLYLKSTGASKAIMPCVCSYCSYGSEPAPTFGKVQWCDATQPNSTSFGCGSLGFIDDCIPDTCVKSADELEDCWSVTAFSLVVLIAYLFLLHRRNASGRTLLLLTCVVEGVLAGAGTLTWNTSVFVHFFAYHCFMVSLTACVICAYRSRWSSKLDNLPYARGHTGSARPPAQKAVSEVVGSTLVGSFVTVVALFLIFFWTTTHNILLSEVAGVLFLLAFTLLWLFYEGERLQSRFCPDEPLHFVVSLHVDMFCVLFFMSLYIVVFLFLVSRSLANGLHGLTMSCNCLANKEQEAPDSDSEEDDSEDESTALSSVHDQKRQSVVDGDGNIIGIDARGQQISSGQRRTSFVAQYFDWKETAKKRLTNMSGIAVISGLFVLCFFHPEAAGTLCLLALTGIPLTRYVVESMIQGKKIRKQLTGKWIDRSKSVHEVDETGFVLIEGLKIDYSKGLQVDGKRFLQIHTGGLVRLRSFQLPSLSGFLKWDDAEDAQITSIHWANGERWTPLLTDRWAKSTQMMSVSE